MTDQELKDLVAGLAVSGERVERNLDRFAEEIRSIQEETARELKELGQRVDKVCGKTGGTDEQLEKTERVIETLGQKVDKVCGKNSVADKQMEDIRQVMKELGRKVDKVCGQAGGISNNNGYYSETFFQDVFERKLEFGGIKYDKMIPNFGRNDDEAKMEIDIALINGDSLALLEVKYRVHPDFIREFAEERVKKFRTLYPKYDNYKIYLGVAGFSFDDKVTERAKEYGVGIVKQIGEGIETETDCLKAY